jgi:N-acetylglucosamine-6-phosphate deacetylase
VSIGHTSATTQQIVQAVRAGASFSTHLGNGSHSVLPRHPNYIWEQLAEDALAASFIVDGIHVPKSFLKVALRTKGRERSILVTDAVMAAGCQPGRFRLGDVEIELHRDGTVRLVGSSMLGGSALQMDRAIENVIRLAGITLSEAVLLATVNPARAARIAHRQRGFERGDRGDLVSFSYDRSQGLIQVFETYLNGSLVYSHHKSRETSDRTRCVSKN